METVSKIIRKYSEKHRRSITDAQKRRSEFTENVAELKNQIIDLINVSNSIETYVPFVEYTKIRTNSNQVFDYEFISKLEIEEINTQYFLSLISRTLKAGKTINWMTITESELQDALLKYDNTPVLQFFSNALHTLIEADLRPKNSIIYQGMDKYAEMSSGLDAKIYFDLLSYEMQQDGIYNYIFSCLNDIITSIQDEIHEPLTETLSNEAEPAKLSKAVFLYELSACAGDGFFMDGASAPEREIQTEYLDADYAVRISGKSMEPTITDGSIVFVKHVNELNEGDIGIFLVDGNVMCKRYCLDGGEKWLRPDNESPEFNAIRIKEGMNCLLQGKVLG